MSTPTYKIRTVADFAKVPKGRLRACLKEFAIAVEMSRALQKALQETQRVMAETGSIPKAEPIEWPMSVFTWTDDKEKIARLSIRILDSPVLGGSEPDAP